MFAVSRADDSVAVGERMFGSLTGRQRVACAGVHHCTVLLTNAGIWLSRRDCWTGSRFGLLVVDSVVVAAIVWLMRETENTTGVAFAEGASASGIAQSSVSESVAERGVGGGVEVDVGAGNCAPVGGRRFYGWTMLGVATVAFIATGPGQTVVVSQFNTAIRDDLGISASALGTAYMVGTVAAAVPLVLAGKASDRFGPRRVMGVVAVLFALSCVLAGQVQGVVSLTVAFFLLRFLGQGVLGLLSGHQLALWFERRLGTVSGLKFVFVNAGFAVLPVLTLWLIDLVGWRLTFACLGVMAAAMVLPLVVWVARDRPEEVGQRIDGDPPIERARVDEETRDNGSSGADVGDHVLSASVDAALDARPDAGSDAHPELVPSGRLHLDPGFRLGQALCAPAFWVINATLALSGMIGTALIFHAQPLIASLGIVDGVESTAAAALRGW